MNVESSKFAPDFFGAAATELESAGTPMNAHPRSVVALRPIPMPPALLATISYPLQSTWSAFRV